MYQRPYRNAHAPPARSPIAQRRSLTPSHSHTLQSEQLAAWRSRVEPRWWRCALLPRLPRRLRTGERGQGRARRTCRQLASLQTPHRRSEAARLPVASRRRQLLELPAARSQQLSAARSERIDARAIMKTGSSRAQQRSRRAAPTAAALTRHSLQLAACSGELHPWPGTPSGSNYIRTKIASCNKWVAGSGTVKYSLADSTAPPKAAAKPVSIKVGARRSAPACAIAALLHPTLSSIAGSHARRATRRSGPTCIRTAASRRARLRLGAWRSTWRSCATASRSAT